MGADADDAPVLDDDDLIRLRHRRNALGHNDHRRTRGRFAQGGPYPCVGVHVERREGVVEQVDGGPADDRPRDGQPLTLTAGEIDAALGDSHVQTVRMGADEIIGGGHLQRVPHVVFGGIGLAVAQVVRHGAGEQIAALRNQADRRPELLGVEVANVDAVDAYRTGRHVVHPADQRYERGFAGTRGADDRRRRTRLGRQRNILEHWALGAGVAERRCLQPDLASNRLRPDRLRGAGDLRLGGQHLGDPFSAHARTRNDHEDERRQQHRHQDLHEVGQERDQGADLHLPGVDPQAAEPDQRDAGDVDDQRGHRQHQRLPAARFHHGVRECLVDGRESVALERFTGERPDHPDTGELFAHDPVDVVDQPLHAPEDRQQVRHDPVVGHGQDRHADQEQPGQPGVLVHRHDDAANRHDRRRDQHRAGQLDQQLDLLDVVGGAGQQCRCPEARGLFCGEARHMVKDRRPQIAAESHAGSGPEVDRADGAEHLKRGDRQHHAAQVDDGAQVALGDAVIDDRRVDGG